MITLEINQEDLNNVIEKLKKLRIDNPGNVINKGFLTAALMVEKKLKENISGRFLKVRSGRLRSSIGSMLTVGKGKLRAEIGSGVRQGERVSYANILETGGVITPKTKSYLTIPLAAAKTPAGVPRFTAEQVRNGATKYITSFINHGIIFGVVAGKNSAIDNSGRYKIGRIVPLFILKTSVSIPAKYWMSKTAKESSSDVINIIIKKIEEAIS